MKKLLRPLSSEIISNLKKGLPLDISHYNYIPVIPEDFKGTLGKLYKKDLINIKRRNMEGEFSWWISITNTGLNFLKKFEAGKYTMNEN